MNNHCDTAIRGRGEVFLSVGGRHWRSGNLVLDGMAIAASLRLCGEGSQLSAVRYGDSAAPNDASQAGPVGQSGVVQVQSVEWDPPRIVAIFQIGPTDNDVETIRELVLFAGEIAVARVVVSPAIQKSAQVQVAGVWRIELEVSSG